VSAKPDYPDVNPIMVTALVLGFAEAGLSLVWAYASFKIGFFHSDFDINVCSKRAQAGVWVQMTVAAECLIFSVRNPSFFYLSNRPSYALIISITLGCLIVSILATASNFFGSLYVSDVAIIWLYDFICLLFIDAIKVLLLHLLGESFDILEEDVTTPIPLEAEQKKTVLSPRSKEDIESRGPKLTPLERWYSSTSLGAGSHLGDTILVEERVAGPASPPTINLVRKGSNVAMIAAKGRKVVLDQLAHLLFKLLQCRLLQHPV
jgi:hypothetical protein